MSSDTCTNGNFLLCTLTINQNDGAKPLLDKNKKPISAWNYNVYIVGVCIANGHWTGGSGVYFTVDVNNNYYCNCYWATLSLVILCVPNNLFDSKQNYIKDGNGNPLYLGNTISKNYNIKIDNNPRPRGGKLKNDSMEGVPMLTGWDISTWLEGTYQMSCYLNPGNPSMNTELGYNTYPSPSYYIGYSNGHVTCNYSFLHPILFADIGIRCNDVSGQIIIDSTDKIINKRIGYGGNYYHVDRCWSDFYRYPTEYNSKKYIVVIQSFSCGLGNDGHLYNYCYAYVDSNDIWNIAIEARGGQYGFCNYLAIPLFLFNNTNGYDINNFYEKSGSIGIPNFIEYEVWGRNRGGC